jgi:YHS domain-containing protein
MKIAALLASIALFFAVSFSSTAHALDPIYTSFFSNKALGGYDSVSYFTDGKPLEGQAKFAFDYQGATWLFASEQNLNAFKANPSQYAPQYGGYCAWAVAQGDDAPGDPLFWKIIDGKLYLNYNAKIQQQWEAKSADFIQAADQKWPGLLKDG